jgi:hypothetical protein
MKRNGGNLMGIDKNNCLVIRYWSCISCGSRDCAVLTDKSVSPDACIVHGSQLKPCWVLRGILDEGVGDWLTKKSGGVISFPEKYWKCLSCWGHKKKCIVLTNKMSDPKICIINNSVIKAFWELKPIMEVIDEKSEMPSAT